LCVAYVKGRAELEEAYSKQKLFHCDFVALVKLTQINIYNLYVNPKRHFSHD
jgi:hypothetical protein